MSEKKTHFSLELTVNSKEQKVRFGGVLTEAPDEVRRLLIHFPPVLPGTGARGLAGAYA